MQSVLEAEISDLSHDGKGVVKYEDKVYFIAGALPGETVSFQPRKKRKGKFDGDLIEVLNASPDRVEPPCQYFGVCGGCTLQHLSSEKQLEYKEKVLIDNLGRLGKVTPQNILPKINGKTWHYRRKARPGSKWVPKKGGVLVGFREQGNSFLTSLKECLTMDQRLSLLLAPLHVLIAELSCFQQIPQLEIAAGVDRVSLILRHLVALTDDDVAKITAFAKQYEVDFYSQSAGPKSVVPIWPTEPQLLRYVLEEFGVELSFSASDFVQVNAEVNESLISRAITLLDLQEDDRVLDLFCGLGNFTLPLGTKCNQVIGVEGDEELVAKGRENAARNQLSRVEFHKIDLHSNEINQLIDFRSTKMLLDPPRSGALDVVTDIVPKLNPQRIVYVSCNPATLARDADVLVNQHGYMLSDAGVVDMFPHTAHVESIALFVKQ